MRSRSDASGRRARRSVPAGLVGVVLFGLAALGVSVAAPVAVARRAPAPVELTMKVSPQAGSLSDTYVLTVQTTVRGLAGPERYWPPELADFEVTDARTQQSTQWSYDPVRGQEIKNVEIRRYQLVPRRAGKLKIGAARLRFEGREYETRPITVEVAAAGQVPAPVVTPPTPPTSGPAAPGVTPPAPTDEPTFLHVAVDRTKVAVGEQVTVTWLLYTRSDVLKFEPKPPRLDDVWAETLFEPKSYFTYHDETVGGRSYAVATVLKRAVFPVRAGKVTIPPYEATVATMSTSFSTPLRLRSPPVTLEVEPLPPGAPAGFEDAYVGTFGVTAQVDRDSIPAGESLTLTLDVRGAGAIRRATIPKLAAQLADDGFQVFQPKDFEERTEVTGDVFRGERRYRYLLTPTRGGTLTIPPIELPYYDPGARRYEVARTQPIPIHVAGDPKAVTAVGGTGAENVIAREIRPIRENPSAAAALTGAHARRGARWLLAAPPLLFALVVIGDKLRERLRRETPRARIRRARGRARRRLRAAELHLKHGRAGKFFAEVARALSESVDERVGEPVSALTREELRQRLLDRGFPEDTVEGLVRELENCDFARFAPSASGPGEMRAALRRARDLLAAIERVRPARGQKVAA